MVNKIKSKIIKTEIVEEEEELDCFGNYDEKELLTCQKCALKYDCSIATAKIKNERFEFRPRLRQVIDETKEKLQESPQVVELIRKVKIKQKKLEKTMDKKSAKKTVVEETPKKKVKKVESEEKPEKKVKKPKAEVETLHGSTIPTTFKALYKGMKEMGTMEKKTSVTNVKGDHGILFCVPTSGRSAEKLEIFVNRSGGYKFKDFKFVEQKISKKAGESFLVVKATEKSMSEALDKLGQWKKDQAKHLAANTGKKAAKKDSDAPKKLKKKDAVEEKSEKKLVKKPSKEEKPAKKTAPVIKPSKKKPEVEDEEG